VLLEQLGLEPGSTVDVSVYGCGVMIIGARTARLPSAGETVVAESQTVITDDDVLALLDAGRR
jgi:hypothetical protein